MRGVLLALAFLLIALPAYGSSTSVLFVGNNTGGVVNGAQVLGATTGNTPVISSQGSDTNVGLIFSTQGSGALSLETAGAGNVILAPGSGSVVIPAFSTAGIVFNNSSGDLSSGTALPNGTTATTQAPLNNSTDVATTAYVDSAVSADTTIKSIHTQTFTSSGTYTPTTGMAYAIVEVVGGGGGGSSSAHADIGGSGGGSGAYAKSTLTAATIGSSQTVTVGSGGAGGSAGSGTTGNAGSNGNSSSLGSLVTAGGGDGAAATGSSGGQHPPSDPGDGGAAGTGDYTASGDPGMPGFGMAGWGGGDEGPGGNGGKSQLGAGGAGGSYTGGAGSAGSHGGGGGGSGPANGGYYAGGAGGAGVVTITEYCTQ